MARLRGRERTRGGESFFLTPMGILFTTVVIDLVGFGIVIPILPLWAEDLGAGELEIGLLATAYAAMQFLFAPVWGRLSDRYGRRPIILLTLAGAAVSSFLIGIAGSMLFLWIARVLNGIAGASYSAAQAYVADITSPEERARGMGLIGAAFGIGFILGPAVGGLCALVDKRFPFFVAAGVTLINLLIAWKRLPEPERRRSTGTTRRAFLRQAAQAPVLRTMVAITFLGTFAFVGMEQTFALFGERRFDFGFLETGLVFAYIGIVAAIVQGKAIHPLVSRFGEQTVMIAGICLTGLGLGLMAVTTNLWALFPVLALLAASGLVFPTVTAIVSRAVSEDDQGGMLGLIASASGLARVIGPVTALALFEADIPLPYLVGSGLFAVCLAIALGGARRGALRPEAV
jgi:multidrug resistance protein